MLVSDIQNYMLTKRIMSPDDLTKRGSLFKKKKKMGLCKEIHRIVCGSLIIFLSW